MYYRVIYFLLLLMAGPRREEAAQLRWDDINFKESMFTLKDTKNRQEITIPLPRYVAELKKGPNMLNYRRYPLAKVPEIYHPLVKPFVKGPSVVVMANELDPILGHLPGWTSDRHPNLAGYNVIADETAKYLAKILRKKEAK